LRQSQGIANVTPLPGNHGQLVRGRTDNRAFATYRYTYSFADGTTVDLVRYTECRTLVAGQSVITIDLVAPAPAYDGEFPLAQDLIAGLSLPSPGEPGPVFVSGQWRLAVAGVARGSRINTAGLAPKPDKDWLLVVVDATNWGPSDDVLGVKDFGLLLANPQPPVRLAPGSTTAAAKALGTAPASANRAVPIPAGQTRRLTLVFQIPHAATGPTLVRAGSALPFAETLVPDNRLAELPPPLGPPFLRQARIESTLGGALLRLTFLNDGSQSVMRLVGIDAPSANDCHGSQTLDELARLVGQTVRVEAEAGSPVGTSIAGYLWLDAGNATPVLVNQQLIAGGFAKVRADEQTARFGAWLAESQREAQTEQTGLWGACPTTSANPPAATPSRPDGVSSAWTDGQTGRQPR
jgi:endonuclease YncB( thermonuclease family)